VASEAVRDEEAKSRADLVDELLERVGHAVGHRAQASAVFGEAVQDGSLTVIPVARTRFGFGAGGGQGNREGEEGSGGGGGGGATVTPIGFIEMRDGAAEFKRISTPMDWLAFVTAASLAVLTVKRLLD
jgi:uncharacterized spore protein YtfJ